LKRTLKIPMAELRPGGRALRRRGQDGWAYPPCWPL
jgi:hypothetical protein